MKDQETWLWCILGMAVFLVEVCARQYMVVRLHGRSGYLSSQRGLITWYRELVDRKEAPRWPVLVSVFCMPLGIAIIFAAILLGK